MPRSAVVACFAGVLVMLAACGGSGRGQGAFCTRLQRDRDTLATGVVDTKTAQAAADRYASLDKLAPEAIRDEWHQLTLLVRSAADLDGASADARAALVQQSYAAAPAAALVTEYARQTCQVDLAPPVAGVATTTVPTSTPATSPPTSG